MILSNKDVLSASQFNEEEINLIFKTSMEMEKILSWMFTWWTLKWKVMASLFFEPSTRTRLSFESAMHRLWWDVISIADSKESSVSKWETIEDSVKIISLYSDILVMRHSEIWSCQKAASVISKPLINAWDWANEHPTQSLLDLYTVFKENWRLDNLKIAIVWDLKYWRTAHSLVQMISLYKNVEFVFICPEVLMMPEKIITLLKEKWIKYSHCLDYKEWLKNADVVYVTRIQKERFPDLEEYEKTKDQFILNLETLEYAKKDITIMHPLPRVNEVSCDIDKLPNAAYFRQAANWVPIRMALLYLLLK